MGPGPNRAEPAYERCIRKQIRSAICICLSRVVALAHWTALWRLGDQGKKRLKSLVSRPRLGLLWRSAGSRRKGVSLSSGTALRRCWRSGSSCSTAPWGTMIQARGLSRGTTAASASPTIRTTCAGDPDVLNLTRPDVVARDPPRASSPPARTSRRPTRSPPRRSARPTTASASSCYELNARARGWRERPATRPSTRAAAAVRGRRGRAAQRDAVDVGARRRPGAPRGRASTRCGGVRRADARAARRRRRPAS